MALLKKLGSGLNTSALFVIGLLILLWLFLSGGTISSPSSTIKNLLTKNGYSDRVAKWWVAVSNLETGRWTSKLFKDYNNLFGMKQPMSRFTYSRGASTSPPGYATFGSWDDSVNDLITYMDQRLYPKDFESIDDMVAFMKSKGYFEDPLYLEKVKGRL